MRVLLTGGTGFIGRHVAERLLGAGHSVTLLLHRALEPQEATLFSRCKITPPVAFHEKENLRSHLDGQDAIVHMARGTQGGARDQWRVTVEGTRQLLQSAVDAGVRRFVHMSSTSVYGEPPKDRVYTENSPRLASLQPYAAQKQAAERIVLEMEAGGTEVVVLQPAIVYGPGTGYWTAGLLREMERNVFVLPRGGSGLCNAVYVMDVAQAVEKAVTSDRAGGECFIVSGNKPVLWRELLRSYEEIIGRKGFLTWPGYLVNTSLPYARLIRRIIDKLIREYYKRPRYPMQPHQLKFFSAKPKFENEKSRQILGFNPEYDIRTGTAEIRQWWQTAADGNPA